MYISMTVGFIALRFGLKGKKGNLLRLSARSYQSNWFYVYCTVYSILYNVHFTKIHNSKIHDNLEITLLVLNVLYFVQINIISSRNKVKKINKRIKQNALHMFNN